MQSVESDIGNEINHTSVQLLLTDAGLALTFVSIAETTAHAKTRNRNMHNARTAYDSIQHLRLRYVLTEPETESLDSQLHGVKSRLEALGQSF